MRVIKQGEKNTTWRKQVDCARCKATLEVQGDDLIVFLDIASFECCECHARGQFPADEVPDDVKRFLGFLRF